MKIAVFFFSGTGNTKKVCEAIADEWWAKGEEVSLFPILRGETYPDARLFDFIVVGFPVHAFNAPASVLSFLKHLPPSGGTPAYLVRTSGEPLAFNDASAVLPRRILKRRGYAVLGEYRYVMPYNIIFRHSEEMAARMWNAAKRQIPSDAQEMLALGGEKKGVSPIQRAVSFVLRIEHTAMPLLGRRFHAAKESCVGCGRCAAVCPQRNIHMKDGKPVFGKWCVGCMACAFSCPADAVRISLLNGWRVNGAYLFEGREATDEEICSYCRKSYLRYFHRAEGGLPPEGQK